jgi:hypothetical protein
MATPAPSMMYADGHGHEEALEETGFPIAQACKGS